MMEALLSPAPKERLLTSRKMKKWTLAALQRELRDVGWRPEHELPAVTPERLRAMRKELGNISQATLALLLSVEPNTVYRWETGKTLMQPIYKSALHFILDIYKRRGLE